jgi:cytochrome oxidase assembly protein ShyY1
MTRGMLRSRRWLLRSLLAVLGIAVCVAAAVWQYHRAQDQVTVAQASVAEVVAYEAVMPAAGDSVGVDALGRQVRVTGTSVPEARSFVRSRESSSGEPGVLVVDGVRQPDGSLVAVLQGWVPDPRTAVDPPATPFEVQGRVQPDENFYPAAPVSAHDQLVTITRAGLAAQWGTDDIRAGYVTATSPSAQFERVAPVIGSDPDPAFPWQNAFYALQWLLFAGFVVFVWVRWVRADLAEAPAAAPQPQDEDRVSL